MRRLFCLVVFLLPANIALASSGDWFGALPAGDRISVQASLVLTGYYTGLIDGVFGPATQQALLAFQTRSGGAPTGELTDGQVRQLETSASSIFNSLGMKQISDARTGVSMFLPMALLSQEQATPVGTNYFTRDGLLSVDTLIRPLGGADLSAALRSYQSRSETPVSYSKLTSSFLVVSGRGPKASYYSRLTTDGDRVVGYEVSWTPRYDDLGSIIAVFAASTIAPNEITTAAPAPAQPSPIHNGPSAERVGSFALSAQDPQTITLDGDIDASAPLDFLRALRERPETKSILLNSNGGQVSPALLVAHEIHARGLATQVPAGSGCYSACAYLFFAGTERDAIGPLGVHQIYGDKVTVTDAQMSLSDVLDELRDFDVSQGVISVMLRTPPDQIHVFTAAEIASLSINKLPPLALLSPNGEGKSQERPGGEAVQATTAEQAAAIDSASVAGRQSLLLEAQDNGTTGAVPFSGTVDWSKGVDENGQPTLVGKANIPARNLAVDVLIRKNSDPSLPASHLMEINFTVSDSFVGGSIAGLPGVLLKDEELTQGTPLVGASARVVGNSFLFALSAAPEDSTANVNLLTGRKWMDLALIYASGKRAIITLEKDDKAQTLFREFFSTRSDVAGAPLTNDALMRYIAKQPRND